VTAPPQGRCSKCGTDQDLCPDGITIARHPQDQHPLFAKDCRGSRKPAATTPAEQPA